MKKKFLILMILLPVLPPLAAQVFFQPHPDTLYMGGGCTSPEFFWVDEYSSSLDTGQIVIYSGSNTLFWYNDSTEIPQYINSFYVDIIQADSFKVWLVPLDPSGPDTLINYNTPFTPWFADLFIIRTLVWSRHNLLADSCEMICKSRVGVKILGPGPRKISQGFRLLSNYRNPFNNQTSIEFYLSKPGNVRITVFNSVGKNIAEIVNRYFNSGLNSVNWIDNSVASGTYFIVMENEGYLQTEKALLIK